MEALALMEKTTTHAHALRRILDNSAKVCHKSIYTSHRQISVPVRLKLNRIAAYVFWPRPKSEVKFWKS